MHGNTKRSRAKPRAAAHCPGTGAALLDYRLLDDDALTVPLDSLERVLVVHAARSDDGYHVYLGVPPGLS